MRKITNHKNRQAPSEKTFFPSLLFHLFFLAFSILALPQIHAEGIPELKPTNDNVRLIINRSGDIGGNRTNFAGWGNTDPFSRLYVNLLNPSQECLYIGLGMSELDVPYTDDASPEFDGDAIRYRLIAPNGVVVVDRTVDLTNLNITGVDDDARFANAQDGPNEITGSGYVAGPDFTINAADFVAAGVGGLAGDYYLEFTEVDENGDPANPFDDTDGFIAFDGFELEFFDFTVADCSNPMNLQEKKGRTWSWRWELTTTELNTPFNGAFYVCAEDPATPDIPNDAFITKIDFRDENNNSVGFMPYAFAVIFNTNGVMNTGNPVIDRQSVEGEDAQGTPEHKAFINDPLEVCSTATFGDPDVSVRLERCSDSGPQTYCFLVSLSKIGSQLDILLDLNGTAGYQAGTADVLIAKKVEMDDMGQDMCLPWDGLDGNGQPVDPALLNSNTVIPTYTEGIFHFPIFDAETNSMSFNITYVRPMPNGASAIKLKWDDSQITDADINGNDAMSPVSCVQVNIEGCEVGDLSCTRCWTEFNYGDRATLNTYWTSLVKVLDFEIQSLAYYTCNITGDNEICPGESTTLTTNLILNPADGTPPPGAITYSWTGPNGPINGATNAASLDITRF